MGKRMIDQFMEMVQIDSESGHEAEFIDYLLVEFKKLGADAHKDTYGNLLAKFPAKNSVGKEPILLSCHADTVMPGQGIKPKIENGVIRSQGDTILGADDKAGIAEMLEALRTAEVRPPVEVAISRQEEVGLLGVKNLDFSFLHAKRGFLLDNDTLDTIVIGGPSYFAIDVDVQGRSAHAGMEPEKGINAIAAAAKAIAALRLGRLDHETTANVGVIKGGIIRNGVPAAAVFLAECRSLQHDKAQALADEMERIIKREVAAVGAQVEIKTNNLCRAVQIAPDAWTVNTAQKALVTVGIKAKTTFITGFTDASIYNNHGIEMAVVGIGARDEHSSEEHIHIADMEKALAMLIEILRLSAA
ncbi:MAG: M20/M25/M40 family metallo-hydrolase [Acidobacteria bacterium]|nr:M20/M25/M40 family metallo-hydrolase [Acidobacteriota bacterium]MBU4306753.1 M20/M25/M40 family metallo-hydrolase [Acidobacteriota bacterium]MBU4405552.1 M20/M25/M40 family metallo-hydrolase [Acidobacteriota bacterium]MCG2810337.1 M20/M25/M40 family metallo-hydrolase [Candidatus Aminicenantes bacterium]